MANYISYQQRLNSAIHKYTSETNAIIISHRDEIVNVNDMTIFSKNHAWHVKGKNLHKHFYKKSSAISWTVAHFMKLQRQQRLIEISDQRYESALSNIENYKYMLECNKADDFKKTLYVTRIHFEQDKAKVEQMQLKRLAKSLKIT